LKKTCYTLIVLAAFFFKSCKEPYRPLIESLPDSFLVVEGVLNPGPKPAVIRLTRTFKLDQDATVKTEDNAQLMVEGKDNTISSFLSTGNGNYVSGNLNLIANHEYRLRIKTVDGKEYLSDYVKAKITPHIDSIGWDKNNVGVQIYINTKDLSNVTRYYRWDYEETWEIHSHLPTFYIYENGVIRQRLFPQEDVSICWKQNISSNILLGNSIRLLDDIIYKGPVRLISQAEDRLSVRYSILVRQYALEQGAYDFFELLKKNTENIGSLFSPQPSELRGNIHCISNPAEYVIGYVTASTIEEKRTFISAAEVFPWWFNMICPSVDVPGNRDSINYAVNVLGLVPAYYIIPIYVFSTPECVDCTKRGGSTIRPVFW